jgi:GT2 family glycosyltransferase
MPTVSVVIPMYNGLAHLSQFADSLNAALPIGSEVILVDDASTEPVIESFPDPARAGRVYRLRNEKNIGYAGAVNRGIEIATGDVIVQLNSDLVLDGECITSMLDLIGSISNIGIVGSKLVYPTTGRTQSVGMAFGVHTKRHVYRHLPADHPLCMKTRRAQIVTGATVAATRSVMQAIGPLDEDLYNHNTDLDHCMRANQVGLQNFMCAESVAYHWHSQSGAARYARVAEAEAAFWSKWGQKYEVDLGKYLDGALVVAIAAHPALESAPMRLVDLTRSGDQAIAMACLAARWPDITENMLSYRQMHTDTPRLSLALITPSWLMNAPSPNIYLVDNFEQLTGNALWFTHRRKVVTDELIVDLSACVLRSSELLSLT